MDYFDMAPTRQDTTNLLKVFSREAFHEEYAQIKATNLLTKNIISNLNQLNLNKEEIKFVKSEKFKDKLFLLLKNNLTEDQLKHLSRLKINKTYIDELGNIYRIVFEDMLDNLYPKYEDLINIISEFYTYVTTDLDLSI